jgi:NAD-reducing hydrogenase small subunit
MTELRVVDLPKARVATASLAGCFGCHMAILDMDERLIDLMSRVEVDRSPLTDKKRFTQRCDIGIVEGGAAATRKTCMCCAISGAIAMF